MMLPKFGSPPIGSLLVKRELRQIPLANLGEPWVDDCRQHLHRLVQQIEPLDSREIVGTVFQDLLRLFECMALLESHLRRIDAADQTYALFQLIHDEMRSLLEFINRKVLTRDSIDKQLFETLDGIAFAINHDLKMVFDNDCCYSISDQTFHLVLSNLYRAHDVVTNCLQQSMIALAMLFDPTLNVRGLFKNSDVRLNQTLQLCEELERLIELLRRFEEKGNELTFREAITAVNRFRHETMRFLMYSDWPQFESFCQNLPATNNPDLKNAFHQFRCYLETLLGQVRMRAVLAEALNQQLEQRDDNPYETIQDSFGQPVALMDADDVDALRGNLAVAV